MAHTEEEGRERNGAGRLVSKSRNLNTPLLKKLSKLQITFGLKTKNTLGKNIVRPIPMRDPDVKE